MHHQQEVLGGTLNQVVKIGDTVHRHPKGGSAVHAYLQYLEKVGMEGVPRFLGLDEQGREILSYLPGDTQGRGLPLGHPLLLSEEMIVGAARFMRRLHDASEGFLSEALERNWITTACLREQCETICHNDAAVWNFVFVDGQVAGLIDFDQAAAGTRIWDLTQSVYGTVHLTPWAYDPELDATVAYDHSKHAAKRKRRLHLYFDAYGMACPPDFMDLVYRRVKVYVCDQMSKDAAAGDETAIRLINNGALAYYTKVAALIKECGQDWI